MDIEKIIEFYMSVTKRRALSEDQASELFGAINELRKEHEEALAKLAALESQPHAGEVTRSKNVAMWVRFNESVDHGEALPDGTKLYVKPVIYSDNVMPMPLHPTKEILSAMVKAINPRHWPAGQMAHVYYAALKAHQGFDFYAKPVPADKPDLVQAIFDASDRKAVDTFKHCPKCNHKCDNAAVAVPDEVRRTLERIAKWYGEFPEAPPFQGRPQSYGAAYGSNGERDYMRDLATKALELLAAAPSHSQQSAEQIPECFKRLTNHAVGMCFGSDWNNGTAATIHRENLINYARECDKYLSEIKNEG